MKGKKQQKKQNATTSSAGVIPRILCIGNVDLELTLEFLPEELEDLEIEFDDLNSIQDLKFLEEKKHFWVRIDLTSNNPTLMTLLYANKVSKRNAYIEYTAIGMKEFSDEEKFFEEILTFVTESNGLTITTPALDEGGRYSIVLNLICDEKVKKIVLGSPVEQDWEKKEEDKNEKDAKNKKGKNGKKRESKTETEEQNKTEEVQENQTENKPTENQPKETNENKPEGEEAQPNDQEGNPQGEGEKQPEDETKPAEQQEQQEGTKPVDDPNNAGKTEENKEEENRNYNEEEQGAPANQSQNQQTQADKKKTTTRKKKKEEEREPDPPQDPTPGLGKKKKDKKKKAESAKNGEGEDGMAKEEGEEAEGGDEQQPKEKSDKLPEFTNSDTILGHMEPRCSSYDMIYINYKDLAEFGGNFKMLDMIELLYHFKTHMSQSPLVIVSYPKCAEKTEEEKKQEEEEKKRKEQEEQNKQNQENQEQTEQNQENPEGGEQNANNGEPGAEGEGAGEQADAQQGGENAENKNQAQTENKSNHEEGKEEETEEDKEKAEQEKECYLNSMFYLTDLYFFDFTEATSSFQYHYKTFTMDRKLKKIDKKKTLDYFIKGIAPATRPMPEGQKMGIFLEKFLKYYQVEVKGSNATTSDFDCRPYPKVNPHNTALIEEYEKIVKKYKIPLMHAFLGGYIGGLLGSSCGDKKALFGGEATYVAYLTGLELIKRLIELKKNNLMIPSDKDFYQVKISKARIEEQFKKNALGSKEGGFILDCTNAQKSAMKDYVALHDYHLKAFFSSEIIRKDLKNKGFINTNGFIMYDPVYRSVMGPVCRNIKKPKGDELDEKLYSSIRNLNVANELSKKEINSKEYVEKSNSPTKIKIPTMRRNECAYFTTTSLKKTKKNKKMDETKSVKTTKEEGEEAEAEEAEAEAPQQSEEKPQQEQPEQQDQQPDAQQ